MKWYLLRLWLYGALGLTLVSSFFGALAVQETTRESDHRPMALGFYVNWDPASWESLRRNIAHLTHVVPVWFHLTDDQGNISDEIDAGVEALAREARAPILPLLNNYHHAWRSDFLHRVLQDAEKRRRLVAAISTRLSERAYAGINIDFEQLQEKDRGAMVDFMRALYTELHGKGRLVTQSVPVDDAAYDLSRLSLYNDFLIPMLYDEHYEGGPSGPISSMAWYEKMLRQAQRRIPPGKIIVGLGSYGYDWVSGKKPAAVLGFSECARLAEAQGVSLAMLARSDNPSFSYSDRKGAHQVWFLNAETLAGQWALAERRGGRGLAVWRLGLEDPAIWPFLARLRKP